MSLYSLKENTPACHPSVVHLPGSVIAGNVTLSEEASVWFNAVIRGDGDAITIGARTNIQDLSMLHVDPGQPLSIGREVTVGHRAVLHGCTVEDCCLIGMGAVVMNGARVGRGSIIAAGSVVLENTVIPPFSLVAGMPASVKKQFSQEVLEVIRASADIYVEKARAYGDPQLFKPVG
ncbi:gamma carbonic anhydrase family protein [Desulfoluna limicola]|uniref:Gamma carbonic anhydrase family protein n=1 Tax=Desulfoluna limicola TaxID=2810562 RepID=A0ABM7PME8_9BACT|nr:gamma carbonic anhydrase family protein [Desulfoluna limicola]BCS98309.1 gamma carbonic anhydrase family protein [Desulfoluna limicola]